MSVRPGGKASFLPRLAGFLAFLRVRGVPIGTGAGLDCAAALRRLALLDRNAVREACKVTLAKSPRDVARVEEAFDLFWILRLREASNAPPAVSAPGRPPPDGLVPSDDRSVGLRIGGDRAGVVRVGTYSPDAPSGGHELPPIARRELLANRAGARRFRRWTATLPGRRHALSRHGKIDFRATARHSLRQGGEWIDFRRKKRKRLRAELVVLWDVSGSMRDHEGRLFALIHSLHRAVRRARSFAFGTHLEEITDLLRGRDYAQAAKRVAGRLGPMGGGTRIGPCLEEFLHRHAALIHPWTTVLVMSDGWDLGEADRLGPSLERIRRRAHRLVWVNPYADDPRFEPATAGMREAMPHLDLLLGPAEFLRGDHLRPNRAPVLGSRHRARPRAKAFNKDGPSPRATM